MSIAVVALSIIAFFAGLAVLVGICAASAHERRQDAALLRVCGARDGDLRWAVVALCSTSLSFHSSACLRPLRESVCRSSPRPNMVLVRLYARFPRGLSWGLRLSGIQ